MVELVKTSIDFVLHFHKHLEDIIERFGVWTYVFLFLIIFCETGLVVMPFLPGDSLLFAAGSFAALKPDVLNVWVMTGLLCIAAVLGDTVNYWLGKWFGPSAFSGRFPLLNQNHLRRTEEFYERYGGKTIILARFVPIIRTFAPFVAGIGAMNYRRFLVYNIVGGLVWVVLFTLMGYYFGRLEIVQKNYELVIVAIIGLSVVPILLEFLAHKMRSAGKAAATDAPKTEPQLPEEPRS